MREQLEERLQQLKQEFESGQQMLAEYEAKQAELRQTLLRISGAIQVLEEMLQAEDTPSMNRVVAEEAEADETPSKS